MLFQPPIFTDEKYFCDHYVGEFSFPRHWHNEIELLYCIKGSGTVTVENETYTIKSGDLCIINSAEEHGFQAEGEDAETLIIEFGHAFLGNRFDELAAYYFDVHVVELKGTGELDPFKRRAEALFSDIVREFQTKSLDSGWMLCGYMYETTALLYRAVPRRSEASSLREYKMKHIGFVLPILDYVTENYQKKITLKEAADLVGYERKAFCRIFKATIGRSFHNYLNEYRVRQAKMMLQGTSYKISEIGQITGLGDSRAFCRTFLAFTGQTPSDYRRMSRKSEALTSEAKKTGENQCLRK